MMAELSYFMRIVAQDYFRPGRPLLTDCYRRSIQIAAMYKFDTNSLAETRSIIRSLAADPTFQEYRKAGSKGFQVWNPASWAR